MKEKKVIPLEQPWRIVNYWKREAGTVVLITISGIIYNIGLLAEPILQGKIIDALLQKAKLSAIVTLAGAFISFILIVQMFRYMKRYYIRHFANRTSAVMRFMIYNRIVYKNPAQLEAENMGSIMTKAISDVESCVEGMRKFTTEIFDTGVALAAYLAALFYYDFKITICACIFIPLAMWLAEKLKKTIYKYTIAYRKEMGQFSQLTYDRMDNAMLYRLYGRERENQEQYEEFLLEFEHKAVIANIWENIMQPIYKVIAMLGIVFVIYFGGSRVIAGTWSVGIFTAYISIFTSMALKASKAAKLFNSVQKAAVSWKRIKPYMETYKEEEKLQPLTVVDEIKVEGLSFHYPDGTEIIKNMSFTLKEGEILGVTGPVACGKSTLGRLFLGNYDYDGHIYLGKQEMKSMSQAQESNNITYMGHEPHLLSDTIYENITLGIGGDIHSVLSMVCFEKDLETMQDGINTKVGNGGIRLSGGQQARIALARTLYHRKKIILLDDPFSAVDLETEKMIMKHIKTICKDNIIILFSHRMAVFEQLQKVLLIHLDKTYLCGRHSDLLNQSKLYQELYRLQIKEGEEANESIC